MTDFNELKISDNIIITDREHVREALEHLNDETCRDADISELIPKNGQIYFFTRDYKKTESTCSDSTSALIPTKVLTKNGMHPTYVSLKKYSGYLKDEFCGYLTGPALFIANKLNLSSEARKNLLTFDKKVTEEIKKNLVEDASLYKDDGKVTAPVIFEDTGTTAIDEVTAHVNNTDYVDESAEEDVNVPAFIKELWQENPYVRSQFNSLKGLTRHISMCGIKGSDYLKSGRDDYYIISPCQDLVLNTGTLTSFGHPAYVLFKWNMKYKQYVGFEVLDPSNEFDWHKNRIVYKRLLSVDFLDGEKFNVFSKDDFILSENSQKHICDHRDRFPENLKKASPTRVAQTVEDRLGHIMTILQINPNYAKAIYRKSEKVIEAVRGELSWYLPLHINTEFDEDPELVVAVKKRNNGKYEVCTVLPWDDNAKNRVTSANIYQNW